MTDEWGEYNRQLGSTTWSGDRPTATLLESGTAGATHTLILETDHGQSAIGSIVRLTCRVPRLLFKLGTCRDLFLYYGNRGRRTPL
jgi:hypothetical protein